MEKCEMKEIHTKEELTKVFEEEEDLVIVQHKRVARVLLRFAGHLPFHIIYLEHLAWTRQ